MKTVTGTLGRGYLLWLLFLINFLNFFDRALPAVVLEQVRLEFDLNDTKLGALSTAFVLVYALAGIPIARLADRFSRIQVLSVGVMAWSAMTAATGLAKNFTSLLLLRVGVGVGEASCAPAANALIADLYPPERRARPMGFFMLGLPLGSIAAFSLGGWLSQEYGWRMPFYAAAIPGVLAAAFVLLAREPTRGAQEAYSVGAHMSLGLSIRNLLSIRTLWWIILSGAAMNFAAYSFNTFLPSLLVRYHGLSVATSGLMSAIVLGATGIIALGAGGYLVDYAHKKWPCGRLRVGTFCLLASAPMMAVGLIQPAGAVASTTVLLAISWSLLFMYYVAVYPTIQDIVRPELRATGMALYFMFMYLLGGGLGTLLTGALSDALAAQAMLSANGSEMTTQFRAIGLRDALLWLMPSMLALTSASLALAMRTYPGDALQRDDSRFRMNEGP